MLQLRNFTVDLARQLFVTFRASVALFSVAVCVCSFTVPQTDNARLLAMSFAIFCMVLLFPKPIAFMPKKLAILFPLAICWAAINTFSPRPEIISIYPDHTSESFLNRMVREEDGIFPMARLLPYIGGISHRESNGLVDGLKFHYAAMRTDVGGFASPLVRTYLGLQSPSGFDVISFEPRTLTRGTVIFLHGFGGNWSLICWLVAQGNAEAGFRTLCPSIGPLGNWGGSIGMEVARETINSARVKSDGPIVLVGLSAGAVGAATIASNYTEELSGVALLFGAHPKVASTGLPVLSVYGTYDERFPIQLMDEISGFIRTQNSRYSEVRLDGADHFALLKKPEMVQQPLRMWLEGLKVPQ